MSRTIEQIVNQQILRWTEEQRLARRSTHTAHVARPRPVICISREFGSLGGEIGKMAAEQLGFSFYAQELVDEIAKQAHVRRKVVESLDERIQNGIAEWVSERMAGGVFAPSDYLRNLTQVVLTLGRHGQCVIVGRGAHVILDRQWTLRVRCIASLEWRVEQIQRRDRLSATEARTKVLRVDEERSLFYRRHFNVDITDPRQFDLLLNPETLTLATCAELIVSAFQARFAEAEAPQSRVASNASSRPMWGETA